jgi:Anti-sigma-K factor rskA/Putative zinc-finger
VNDPTRLTHEEAVELAAPFVLNALEPDEEEAVREHLRGCPLPHEEFAALGSAVPALAETIEPIEPPAALKGRILAAAAADLAAREAAPARAVAPPSRSVAPPSRSVAPPAPEPIPIDSRRRPSPVSWFLVAAAGIAIVALVAVNLLTLGRLNSSEQYERDVAAVLEAGSQPGAVTAVLAPTESGGPRGLAAVSSSGDVTMAMQDLAPTSGNEVYEGWAIVGDAAPVPLGGFTVGEGGTGRLDGTGVPAEPGMTVALTREPGSGATTPTLPILAAGTAGAPAGATGLIAVLASPDKTR